MTSPKTWRDTLTAIEDGALRHMQATVPVDPKHPDCTEPRMLVFRGEDAHVSPDNQIWVGPMPARDIKSSLRLHLEKRLKCLEKMGQQPADWDDQHTARALHRLEDQIMQVALQHHRARPSKSGSDDVSQTNHDDWNYDDQLILWVLRHHDGPINRIDFSRSLYIALYFACEPATDENGHEQPGAVIALAVDPYHVREFDIPRARSQHAVLIHAKNGILDRQNPCLAAWPVPAAHKQDLRNHLKQMHAISGEVLFPDIPGAERSISRLLKRATPAELEDWGRPHGTATRTDTGTRPG